MNVSTVFAVALFQVLLAQAQSPGWRLVWADEFDYHGLPDPTKWTYEEGLLRNRESQYYTKARWENARVENGDLVIECRKESYTPTNHAPVEYTSASLTTKHTASWLYGRIEVRAKLPQGRGVWPAIWTLGTNVVSVGWPRCGEIDIMEFVGKQPEHVYGTVHYSVDGKHQSNQGIKKESHPYEAYHVYAVEWSQDRIDFFFDQQRFHSFAVKAADCDHKNPFREPHFLLINLALGGNWGGKIDDAVLPQKYCIDYVRVYQRLPEAENRKPDN
jgi:beta-glucanase (GH16 family)